MTIIVGNTLKGLCYRKSDCQNDNYEIAYIIIGKGSSLSGIVFEPGILGTPCLPCPIRLQWRHALSLQLLDNGTFWLFNRDSLTPFCLLWKSILLSKNT